MQKRSLYGHSDCSEEGQKRCNHLPDFTHPRGRNEGITAYIDKKGEQTITTVNFGNTNSRKFNAKNKANNIPYGMRQ